MSIEYVPIEVIAVTGVVTGHEAMGRLVVLRFATAMPPDRTYGMTLSQTRELVQKLQACLAAAAAESSRGSGRSQ
jgi:hypothetical protein